VTLHIQAITPSIYHLFCSLPFIPSFLSIYSDNQSLESRYSREGLQYAWGAELGLLMSTVEFSSSRISQSKEGDKIHKNEIIAKWQMFSLRHSYGADWLVL
jgi:hypothetical protein